MMQISKYDPIDFSLTAFQLMLRLYPQGFRDHYGRDMALTFQDVARRSYIQEGSAGLLWLWASTFFDMLKSALEEHLQQGVVIVSQEKLRQLAGRMIAAGGLLWMISGIGYLQTFYQDKFGGSDLGYELAQWVGPVAFVLLMIGFYGLYLRLRPKASAVAKLSLITAAASPLLFIPLGLAVLLTEYEAWWYTLLVILLLNYTALFVFGLASIRESLLPRWNFTPLLASLPMVVSTAILLSVDFIDTAIGEYVASGGLISLITYAISGLFILLMGVALLGDRQPVPKAA